MKKTPLYDRHVEMDAKIVSFAGFLMPVEYSGIITEHENVRNNVGVFDVSHMGEIWIKGEQAYDFLQYTTSNNIADLSVGKAQYSCLPNGKGGIVDDVILYMFSKEKYLLVVNAANIEKDFNWLKHHEEPYNIELENASDNMAQISVQGPKAINTIQKITDYDIANLNSFEFVITQISNVGEVIISTTGYTGSGGVEIYCNKEEAGNLWDLIFEAGKSTQILPTGLAARDTLRLEMGYCLYGNDIDDTTSPIEAGLGWITKFQKAEPFIDMDVLLKQKENGVPRKLVGFELLERGIPRHGYSIVNNNGDEIGTVTSGTMSPSLNKGIGMGYVQVAHAQTGQEIYIKIRNKQIKSKVVKPPFYKG